MLIRYVFKTECLVVMDELRVGSNDIIKIYILVHPVFPPPLIELRVIRCIESKLRC